MATRVVYRAGVVYKMGCRVQICTHTLGRGLYIYYEYECFWAAACVAVKFMYLRCVPGQKNVPWVHGYEALGICCCRCSHITSSLQCSPWSQGSL